MSAFNKITGKAERTGPRYVPDHERIVRGIPFQGPAEDPCPAPVPAWHSLDDRGRPWGSTEPPGDPMKWELREVPTGDVAVMGGYAPYWFHKVYYQRTKLRKYQRDTAAKQAAQQFSDPSGRYEQGYGREQA